MPKNIRTPRSDSQARRVLRVIDGGGGAPTPTPPSIAVVRSPELRDVLWRLYRAHGHEWGPPNVHEHAAALGLDFVTFRDRLRRLIRLRLVESDVGVRVRVRTLAELRGRGGGSR